MFAAAMESFAHQSGRQGGIQAGAARDGADQGTSDTRRRLTGQTPSTGRSQEGHLRRKGKRPQYGPAHSAPVQLIPHKHGSKAVLIFKLGSSRASFTLFLPLLLVID
jgi:hypothetical protein